MAHSIRLDFDPDFNGANLRRQSSAVIIHNSDWFGEATINIWDYGIPNDGLAAPPPSRSIKLPGQLIKALLARHTEVATEMAEQLVRVLKGE